MRSRMRAVSLASALSTGVVLATVGLGPVTAQAATGVPTITAWVSNTSIALSSGHTVQAGRVVFKVVADSGDHTLQLAKLAPGYTFAQAGRDLNNAFAGKVSAVRTVDSKIRWLGGAEATFHHIGWFAETLYAGTYYLVDQNSNAVTTLRVTGTPVDRPWIANASTITATQTHGFATSPSTLPRSGWTLFRNTADEPHFVVFQQVQPTTTAQMVRAYLNSGSQAPPSWALPGSTSTGVVSGGSQVLFHYDLPAGKYVIMCWWPDDETGMPHALMGMWKLITLR